MVRQSLGCSRSHSTYTGETIFIATNMIMTKNQRRGRCAEDFRINGGVCDKKNNTCVAGMHISGGNGVATGRCIASNENSSVSTCEIYAWCPVENPMYPLKTQQALFSETEDFTLMIKNYIDFPGFKDVKRRNIKDDANSTYLRHCRFHPEEEPYCPIFRLGDIVQLCGITNYSDIADRGGIIAMTISWICDFDYPKEYCLPKYGFHRLDDANLNVSAGWNFRFARYYNDDTRTLYKMTGIKLFISVSGRGSKFHILPLLLNIGSGIGLLGLTTVICDIIVLHIDSARNFYKSRKFEVAVPSQGDDITEMDRDDPEETASTQNLTSRRPRQ